MLNNYDIRSFVDDRNEKVGRKIRDAEMKKVPFMILLGEKEVETNQLAVRKHGEGDLGTYKLEAFVDLINTEIKNNLN